MGMRGVTSPAFLRRARLRRLEHFATWYRLTYGEVAAVAWPGVPVSLVFPLYEAVFVAHETRTAGGSDCARFVGGMSAVGSMNFRCKGDPRG